MPEPLVDDFARTKAAEETNYTTSPGAALANEPEAIDREDQALMLSETREQRVLKIREKIADAETALLELDDDGQFASHASQIGFTRNLLKKLETEMEDAA